MGKTADEATLVVLHHLIEVVLEELHFEIGKVEPAVIVCRKLVSYIENDLICMSSSHESVRHCLPNFENLIVRGDQLVEVQGGVRVN